MFSLLAKLFHNCTIKLSYTIYFLHVISFINYTITFNPIVLRDNTRENEIVSKDFLLNYIQSGYKLSLLQSSKGREYFDINENHQLITSRFIDRDKLCLQSRLCCPLEGSTTTITTTSTISSNIGSFEHTNFMNYQYNYLSHTTSRNNIHGLQTQSTYYPNLCSAKIDDTESLYNPMCTFNLTVSVMTSPSEVPDTHQITIIICDENDHVPQFKHPKDHLKMLLEQKSLPASSDGQPILITNLSEASPVGSRIVLPLAEDLDSSPFNVQRYELENLDHLNMSESDLPTFQLNYTKNIVTSSDGHYPSHSIGHVSNDRTESVISKLELVLLKPLNREEKDKYKLRILAIDGGQPSQTGTLYLFIHVLDINDHAPVFNQSVYEIHVSEGIINKTILQLSATDADDGENAVIIYKFPKGSEWITSISSSLLTSNDVVNVNQYPPGYWFHLDDSTGRLSIQRPLDYETKSEHILEVLAYNPPSVLSSSNHRISSDMTATAKIIVKVDNEYDEPPFIQIDYSNEKNEHYKHVTENSMNLYFIAFIIVTDPDYNDNNNYHLHSSSSSISSLSNRVNSASLSKTALISCKLETHDEFYSLFESDNYKLNKANEVRYVLQTIKSLDREIGDENRIVISCTDSDIPPKTSTATVVVEIDDQNDCIPEIHVSTLSLTAANIYNTDKFQQRQPKDYIPVQPWSMKKLTYLLETEQDKHKVYNSPIFLAFLANISVYTVYIPENRPSSTLIAHLNATDNDSGENGRVTFEMIESYSFNNLFSKLSYSPQFQHILLNQQTYNNNNNNHMNDDVIEIHSKQEAFDLFQINATHGDLTTRQLIDREENGIITNEVFILIKATDHGISHQLHSFALIQVIILDENDNPPRIISTGPTFNIEENQPTGTKIGEIAVIDPDIFSFVQLDDIYYPGLLEKQTGDYFGKSSSSFSQIPKQQQQQQQQHQHKGLQVRIDPGHGRRDLPFTLHEIGNGRYFLNTTRPLDRETEEAFQFIIVATDNEPVRTYHDIKNNYPSAYIINNHRYPGHTASLSVIVNVIDVNDNRPEIIFPNPMTSNSTVHRLSYRVYAGHEIISINANDRDADQFNGKFHFEMVQDLKSSDLFTIDRDNGMLKTRRTLTKDDLGEYQVHIIVRDEGQPSLETQLLLRLLIDQSEPQWASNIKNNRNYQFNDFLSSSSSSNQMHSNNHHTLRNNLDLYDRSQHELYTTSNDLLALPLFKNLDSNVLLFIIIIVILFFILIMIGLCIYLRHKYNFLHFIPDIYDNNKCSCCSTCLLSRRSQSTLSSNIDEKPYLKNLLDHTTVTTTTTTTTNITAHCNNNTPIKTIMTTNTATTTTLKYLSHIDYGVCTDLLKYKQTNFNLGSLTPVSPICCSHSVVHLPISHNNNNQQQRREHHLITNSRNCRHRENQDFFVDSDVSNALIADNTSSFSNSLSPSHSNYDFNDFSRKHTSYVTNSNHRCWPINPLTVNIPNIVNETNDTMHGSYYHFVPNSFGVEFPNQSKKNFYRGYKPGNGLLHTYNVGEQQQYVPNGRLCYINECNETSNAHLAPRNAWDASEFEFRPIKDTINSYQAASFTESGKSDDYVRPQVHSLHRTPIPDNDQYIGNNSSVCYPQLTSHLSVWKSDPYLNQSMHDLIKKQHNKESNQIWTETNLYNKIGSTLDGINLIPEYYGTQLKRSKSTRHTTDKDLISTKLQNKPMPFNSNFNNGEDQSSKQLRMITVHPSSDKNDTITTGCHNNSITTTDNNNDIHCTKTNQMSQYAISFPTVQASFV